jgi:hypothetical protein
MHLERSQLSLSPSTRFSMNSDDVFHFLVVERQTVAGLKELLNSPL